MSRGDKITFFLLLLLIVFSFFLTKVLISQRGEVALIMWKGKEIKSVSLNDEGEFKIRGSLGEMTLEVKEGRIKVIESRCPLKVCIKEGWISNKGEEIICIPNEVRVKIKGEDRKFDEIVH
jgi:hypothetical protein